MPDISTDKFTVVMLPECDKTLDAQTPETTEAALKFTSEVLPNIARRDAIMQADTPLGTLFTFQIPETNVLLNTIYRKIDGVRVLVVCAVGVAA